MAPKWITGLLILHASLVFCDAQFCDGIADNFTTPVNIREAVENTLTLLPEADLYFRDWIFPNSLKFPCRGLLAGWIFRANNNTNLIELISFPQWGVYTKSTGTSQLSYNLKGNGSFTGLSKIADGVYQYSLQSPLQVEEGDIVGVQYLAFPDVTNSLLLSFIDGGSGAGSPVSYRSIFTGELFIIDDDGVEILGIVTNDTRYTPLVTAVMSVNDTSTTVVLPASTMLPTITSFIPTTTSASSSREGISTSSNTLATTSPMPMVSLIPSPDLVSTTPQPTDSFSSTSSSNIKMTSATPIPTLVTPSPLQTTTPTVTTTTTVENTEGPSDSIPVAMIEAIAGLLLVIIVIVLVLVAFLLVLKKRRRKKEDSKEPTMHVSFGTHLENPIYLQGNQREIKAERRVTEVVYEQPQKVNGINGSSFDSNGTFAGLNGHARGQNGNFSSHEDYAQMSLSLEGRAEGQSLQHYEEVPGVSIRGGESSAVYYEVKPTRTEEPREPQDYALPVSSAQSTLESQPYEVPVQTLSKHASLQQSSSIVANGKSNAVYGVLEGGAMYVPTEKERMFYSSCSSATLSTSSSLHSDHRNFDESIYSQATEQSKIQVSPQASFFVEEDIYWVPASSKRALYDQLANKKYREILRPQIRIVRHLGSGQFGTVNLGFWKQLSKDVAVKMLKAHSTDDDKVKFLQEAAIMGQFMHPHVVKLHGVVTVGDPVMIVLEYMEKGDLKNYLLSQRGKHGGTVNCDPTLPHLLLKFCRDIASGMEYLSKKSFVHRDLAARNILLGVQDTCKIGDFGMSRDLEDKDYYVVHGGQIPVKWTAPEALHFRKYSTASDVWSYGAVMYEIWTLGRSPFEGYSNAETLQLLSQGFRLPPPPGCSRVLYKLTIRCWHEEAARRPLFSAIVTMLAHNDASLINWNEEDASGCPLEARSLGAPVEASKELYKDLQNYYMPKGADNI